ncbi:MAG: ATP-binding protein, partial [Planctomycetota bacterium]|jgi:tetratricopeptide (TPR) repeat protein
VLLIEGEAGIGKTRLVDEFVGRLHADGEDLNFLFGDYPPGGAATAAGAFSTAYREHFGEAGLEERLGDYLAATQRLVAAFAALLRGSSPPQGEEPLNKDTLQTVFVHATRALAAERPTIIMIDDLHFAPDEGRAVFAALALAVQDHRVLLIGTNRPGLPQDWVVGLERRDCVTRMKLPRLGAKDLGRLLIDVFGSERVAKELALQIGAKSDGNPFFVFEIIRGLREGQFITKTADGTWTTTGALDQIQIPSSVMDLIQARMADLSDEEREILDVAACCGFEFDPLLIGGPLGIGSLGLLRTLGRIERTRGLVRSVGVRCVFDHHQVQEALYGGLSELLRREYHAALGEALERREHAIDTDPSALKGSLAVDLCEHFFRGERPRQALRYLSAALDHFAASYLNDDAIRLCDRALAAPELLAGQARLEVLRRKAGRLDLAGRRDEERATLDEALEIAESAGDARASAVVRERLGQHFFSVASYEEATEVLSVALRQAQEAGEKSVQAQVVGQLGSVCWTQGRFADARGHFERHLALSRELGDRAFEARAWGNLGNVLYSEGQFEEAQVHFERSLALSREIGDLPGEARATGNLAGAVWALGHGEEARTLLAQHLALTRAMGDRQGEAVATGNLGAILRAEGESAEALEHLERHLALAREVEYRRGEVYALLSLGAVFADFGSLERGRDCLEQCRALAAELGLRSQVAFALFGLGGVAEQGGETAEAERLYNETLALRRELGHQSGVAETLIAQGALRAAEDKPEEARPLLEEALALAREIDTPGQIVLATAHLAGLPGGEPAAALEAFAAHQSRLKLRQRMQAGVALWKATNDPTHLEEAHRLLCFVRDDAPEDCRTSVIENVPLHRTIMKAWEEHGKKE